MHVEFLKFRREPVNRCVIYADCFRTESLFTNKTFFKIVTQKLSQYLPERRLRSSTSTLLVYHIDVQEGRFLQ